MERGRLRQAARHSRTSMIRPARPNEKRLNEARVPAGSWAMPIWNAEKRPVVAGSNQPPKSGRKSKAVVKRTNLCL